MADAVFYKNAAAAPMPNIGAAGRESAPIWPAFMSKKRAVRVSSSAARVLDTSCAGQRPGRSSSPGHRPGERCRSRPHDGPTGQSLVEGLARWADNTGSIGPVSPGRCPGLGEPCPFGAITVPPRNLAAPAS
jgi:hypothetical protein